MANCRRFADVLARTLMCSVLALALVGVVPANAAPAEDNGVVVVAPGDTLGDIAARYGVSSFELMRLNNISSPDLIHAGQRLILPGMATVTAPDVATPAASAGGLTHTVQRGETLVSIAATYGISIRSLMQINNLSNPKLLRVGQVLTIPGTGLEQPAAPTAVPIVATASARTTLPTAVPTTVPALVPTAEPAALQTSAPTEVPLQVPDVIPTLAAIAPTLAAVAPTVAADIAQIYGPQPGPAATSSANAYGPVALPTAIPTPSPVVYTVQVGDTLAQIAAKYGISQQAILSANSMPSPNLLNIGQMLTIPGTTVQVQVTVPTSAPSTPDRVGVAAPKPPGAPNADKWIEVNLTKQRLTAWEGDFPVFSTLVSTGLPGTPTVTGTFRTYVKLDSTRMVGPGYNLPNVPWTMYFYAGYGIHGAYWHHNFGHPMSHGCVNMRISEAKWIYDWAPMGTQVFVHN